MIKRIELVNFMSHRHTVIDLAEGLTVLVGPNNCGKSAVVTALRILAFNENSTYVTRHGEKSCAVRVESVDAAGQTRHVEWSRGSRNGVRYKVDDELFDRLKGRVPEEVAKALQISLVESEKESFDVHFGQQSQPVFLLEGGRAAAEFFASASDAVHLREMQRRHKTKTTAQRSEKTTLEESTEQLEAHLEFLQPIDQLDQLMLDNECLFHQLREEGDELERGEKLIQNIQKSQSDRLASESSVDVLLALQLPPEIEPEQPLEQLLQELKQTQANLNRAKSESEVVNELPDSVELVEIEPMAKLIRDLKSAQTFVDATARCNQTYAKLTAPPEVYETQRLDELVLAMQSEQTVILESQRQLTELNQLATAAEKAIEKWVVENPSCPTCGSEMDNQSLPEHSDCEIQIHVGSVGGQQIAPSKRAKSESKSEVNDG